MFFKLKKEAIQLLYLDRNKILTQKKGHVICGLAGHMDMFYSLAFLACCLGLLSLVSYRAFTYLSFFFYRMGWFVFGWMNKPTHALTHSALEHSRISWPQIF